MDKRLSLALLLTAIVVAITPILFPTPKRPAAGGVQQPGDSAVVVTDTLANTRERSQPSVAPLPQGQPRLTEAPDNDENQGSGSASIDSPGRAVEITSVSSARSTYQFSSMGAAPVKVSFEKYGNLAPGRGDGRVVLSDSDAALIEYSLVGARDTLSLANTVFDVSRETSATGGEVLTYRATVGGTGVAISYTLVPDRYVLKVAGRITGGQSRFLLISLPSTLPPTEADTLSDLRTLSYSFKPENDNARGVPFGKLDPGEKLLERGPLTWAAVRNKYFVVGVLNTGDASFEELNLTGGPRTSKVATHASAVIVSGLADETFSFDVYIGPQQSNELLAMGRDFDHVNPYGWRFLQPIINPIAALCIQLLLWLHDTLKLSYGWVLVLFGVFIRMALWPLNQSAMRASLKMQELQPRLAEVQKKYKDKPERQREEMMKVYSEAGASPFTALSGCLPMLIPMPVLFALFFVFQNTIEFRGVPFLWLPDISVKDPYYILPVLMGVSMYVLSWIGLRNAPPNPQAKMMSYMFPVMMTFVLANMASGLNLYYTSQNIAALPQQWLLARERLRVRQRS